MHVFSKTQRKRHSDVHYYFTNDVYHKINDVTNVPLYSRLKQDYINFILQATFGLLLKLASKIWCHFVKNLQRYDTKSAHVPKRAFQFASEKLQYTGIAFI